MDNAVLKKSKSFALRIIGLSRFLREEKREFILSKQVLRSGTSIGANVKEAEFAQSKADFYSKMYIAFKEAAETEYWLELLHDAEYINDNEFYSIYPDCQELLKLLSSITKTQKSDE